MSRLNPTRFVAGLVIEVAALAVGVSLLPRLAGTGADAGTSLADQRPTLLTQVPLLPNQWHETASRQETSPNFPPADPIYIERRLDQAGQQLLEGVSSFLRRSTDELLAPPAAPAFAPPENAYRY